MKFSMTIEQIQCIQKRFKYSKLLCVEKKMFQSKSAEAALRNAGIIYKDPAGRDELRNEERYLFGTWEKMRYSVIRADTVNDEGLYCVLANNKEILIFNRIGHDVEIDLIDFDPTVMDHIFFALAEIDETAPADVSFNISLSVRDFSALTSNNSPENINNWSSKLGIDSGILNVYVSSINSESDYTLLLCEDHQGCVGALAKIVKSDIGVCALKHITPEDSSKERVVAIVGNAQQIANSLYLF